jgi:hypothetical protein
LKLQPHPTCTCRHHTQRLFVWHQPGDVICSLSYLTSSLEKGAQRGHILQIILTQKSWRYRVCSNTYNWYQIMHGHAKQFNLLSFVIKFPLPGSCRWLCTIDVWVRLK